MFAMELSLPNRVPGVTGTTARHGCRASASTPWTAILLESRHCHALCSTHLRSGFGRTDCTNILVRRASTDVRPGRLEEAIPRDRHPSSYESPGCTPSSELHRASFE